MNVLLLYPRHPETFWSFKRALKFVSKKTVSPPLGLLTVASMLPSGWNKRLVDTNIHSLNDSDIQWADVVFISAMLVQKNHAQKLIDRCKAMGKRVVAGGPAFTTSASKFKGVDHLVLNEAEVTLPLFLKDFKNGVAKKRYTSEVKPDIKQTPIPSWNLINLNDYSSITIQYSRGCPFNCEFCDIIIMNGRVPRTKSPRQMIKELTALYNANYRGSVFIVDDNFIGNKFNVKKMLRLVIKWQRSHDYPFTFLTEASVNLSQDEELMTLMRDANFTKVFLGIETPNPDSLKECKKMQNTVLDLEQVIKRIHQHGMQVMGGFIVGFDSDTEKIFDSQINFIQRSGVVNAMVGLLSALPMTRLWHRLKREGRLLKDTSGENTDGLLDYIPKMDKDLLLKGYHRVLSTIYSPNNYYQRIKTFLKDYKPCYKARLNWVNIKAFFKSTWEIGVLSNSRGYYWNLFFSTLFKKAKAFPAAIELAIAGLHFEQVTKRVLSNLDS